MPSSVRSLRCRRSFCSRRSWSIPARPSALVKRAVVLAGVVVLAGRRRVGEGAGRNEVAPAHLFRRLPELGRHDVDQPLQVVGGFRAAGPAIRRHRGRVGEDARGLQIDGGELVDADAHEQREVGNEGEDRIGADVRGHLHAQRGDGPVVFHRGLEVGDLGAPVRGGHHVLHPRLDPLERPGGGAARGRPAPRPRHSSRTCCRSRRPCPG